MPQAGVERARVVRVDDEVGRAGLGVAVEDALPALAAVRGAEHAPLGIAPERMPHGSHVHSPAVARVDADARDRLRVLQPEVGPGLAAVGGPVDAVALDDVLAPLHLAGARI